MICQNCGAEFEPRPELKWNERFCCIACAHLVTLRLIVIETGWGILKRVQAKKEHVEGYIASEVDL